MKGKLNFKTVVIFLVLLVVIVLGVIGVRAAKTFISGATAGYEPQGLKATPKSDGKTATVSWTTDKEVKASIFYGTNMASLLLMAEDIEAATSHSILLTNLKSNTTYYYKVVADDNNVFDNGGLMYSFKTLGSDDSLPDASTPTLAPSISPSPTATVGASNCNRTTDYNKDGVVNSLDYLLCTKGKVTPAASASGSASDPCAASTDYNKDGVVNSLDRIKCLQDNKR